MRFSSIFSDILQESNTHMRLTWCASTLKKGFKLFQIYSYADTSWADDKNSRKSTCCYLVFVHNAAFSWPGSCLRLLWCLLPKMSSLELVLVLKRFNSVGNYLLNLDFGNTRLHRCSKIIRGVSHLQSMGILRTDPNTFTCDGCLSPSLFEMEFSNCIKFLPPSK